MDKTKEALDIVDALPADSISAEDRILLKTNLEALDIIRDQFVTIQFSDFVGRKYYRLSNSKGWCTGITEGQYETFKDIFNKKEQ